MQQARGLFGLQQRQQPIPPPILDHEQVAGVSLRLRWADLESVEGQHDWGPIDREIRRAERARKTVMLRVLTGIHTPEWVYAAGAERFEFRVKGQRQSIPIPWDPVFLKKWAAFIWGFGACHRQHHTVVLVHMTGPAAMSGEMHLPKTPADKLRWKELGYTPELLIGAWRRVIDAYADAFPAMALALNVAVPIYPRDGVVEAVMAHAHERLGERTCFQHNALKANNDWSWHIARWIKAYLDRATIGFQQLCPRTPQGEWNDHGRRYGGTLRQSFEAAFNHGASFLELYTKDLLNRDETFRNTIRWAAEQLADPVPDDPPPPPPPPRGFWWSFLNPFKRRK